MDFFDFQTHPKKYQGNFKVHLQHKHSQQKKLSSVKILGNTWFKSGEQAAHNGYVIRIVQATHVY